MTWTEGTLIISDTISISGGYLGIISAIFGIIVIIGWVILVALLFGYLLPNLDNEKY